MKWVMDLPIEIQNEIINKNVIEKGNNENQTEKINEIQKKILENASKYLKVGGILIYSTCTNVFLENQETIKWFLEKNKNFKIITDENIIPEEWKSGLENGMLSLLPNLHGTDGFFICCLTKTE